MSSEKKPYSLVLAGLFLALALILPFLTAQIPAVGSALCPMHMPVLLCGFFCGPWFGAAVGLIGPLLRFLLFGMPPILSGIAMSLELAAYGLMAGLMYRALPHGRAAVYAALIAAMLAGRIVWGAARVVLYGLGGLPFSWALFWAGAFTNAVPGIIVQIAVIPVLVITLSGMIRKN